MNHIYEDVYPYIKYLYKNVQLIISLDDQTYTFREGGVYSENIVIADMDNIVDWLRSYSDVYRRI